MFATSYKSRVERHLSIFNKAVEGLKRVQADIDTEMSGINERNQELQGQIESNKNRKQELATHHGQIGSTIQKISQIFP